MHFIFIVAQKGKQLFRTKQQRKPTIAYKSHVWTDDRRWRSTGSVGEMLDELELPSLGAHRDQAFLLLIHNIHCGTVSIDMDKNFIPAHSLKTTISSQRAQ